MFSCVNNNSCDLPIAVMMIMRTMISSFFSITTTGVEACGWCKTNHCILCKRQIFAMQQTAQLNFSDLQYNARLLTNFRYAFLIGTQAKFRVEYELKRNFVFEMSL